MKYFLNHYFLLSLFLFILYFQVFNIIDIFALKPMAIIDPVCHNEDEERINMTINGFNKNSSVYWEFINSKGIVESFGYFDTNTTGGFHDYTIADDFPPDNYIVSFFDDKNNDFIKDIDGVELNATYSIPCNG
ncbi:MAG: hypothetical protein ACE5SW_07020 [Nitrososphaeraceae archaeon]